VIRKEKNLTNRNMHKVISEVEMRERIDGVLYKAGVTAGGLAASCHTPLDALIEKEDAEDDGSDHAKADARAVEALIRRDAFSGLMGYFFAEGPEPLALIRRVYAVAKATRPDLLGDMSLQDLALLCGDGGRATVSARIERIYNKFIEERGGGKVKAAFQKSETACSKYREVQRGNDNRKRGKRKAVKAVKGKGKRK
jgi:hypothetical protein